MVLPAPTSVEGDRPLSEARQTASLAQIVMSLASQIRADHYPPGDRADLRRLDPSSPGGPAFWRLMVRFVEEHPAAQLEELEGWAGYSAWAVLLAALGEGAELHTKNFGLGRACFEAKVSEARFTALLRASGTTLWRAVRQLVHQLTSAGQRVDFTDLARLLLSAPENPQGTRWRRRMAGGYYRAEAQTAKQASKEERS